MFQIIYRIARRVDSVETYSRHIPTRVEPRCPLCTVMDVDLTTRGPMVTQSAIEQLMYVPPCVSDDLSDEKNLRSDQHLGDLNGNNRPGIWLRSCPRLRDLY